MNTRRSFLAGLLASVCGAVAARAGMLKGRKKLTFAEQTTLPPGQPWWRGHYEQGNTYYGIDRKTGIGVTRTFESRSDFSVYYS